MKVIVFLLLCLSALQALAQGYRAKANPTSLILSAAMLLEWIGEKKNAAACAQAGKEINRAVDTWAAASARARSEMP